MCAGVIAVTYWLGLNAADKPADAKVETQVSDPTGLWYDEKGNEWTVVSSIRSDQCVSCTSCENCVRYTLVPGKIPDAGQAWKAEITPKPIPFGVNVISKQGSGSIIKDGAFSTTLLPSPPLPAFEDDGHTPIFCSYMSRAVHPRPCPECEGIKIFRKARLRIQSFLICGISNTQADVLQVNGIWKHIQMPSVVDQHVNQFGLFVERPQTKPIGERQSWPGPYHRPAAEGSKLQFKLYRNRK